MKKLGIVGGVAWPSTIDYYKGLCRLGVDLHSSLNLTGPPAVPEMTIESLNIAKSFALRGGAITDDLSWAEYDRYFREALERIERNGAEVALIASNTPHNRFSAITRGIKIPVLNIFDAVASHCKIMGITNLLILGTAPTMASPVFGSVLEKSGIHGFVPSSHAEREKIVALIAELYADKNDNADSRIAAIVDAAYPANGGERAVCLACTELPLAFKNIENETDLKVGDIHYLNTTMIHVKAAFEAIVGDDRHNL
jgi:aspartate racemase